MIPQKASVQFDVEKLTADVTWDISMPMFHSDVLWYLFEIKNPCSQGFVHFLIILKPKYWNTLLLIPQNCKCHDAK